MKNLFFLLIYICINLSAFSQEESNLYFEKKIKKVENTFENILLENSYIVYCTTYKLHLILQKGKDTYFNFIFIDDHNEYKLLDIKTINSPFLTEVFDRKNYQKGYIDTESNFYKNGIVRINGLPTCFSYNINLKEKYCEYLLSVNINPIPMKTEIYNFFINLLIL